jgi:hypothetical protein
MTALRSALEESDRSRWGLLPLSEQIESLAGRRACPTYRLLRLETASTLFDVDPSRRGACS